MKLMGWMGFGSVLSAVAITVLFGPLTGRDVALGMTGPLVASLATSIAIERVFRRNPVGVTSLMLKAFAAKMVFFAAYVSLILGLGFVRPIPFVISFTIYFLALHITAAISLRRLITA